MGIIACFIGFKRFRVVLMPAYDDAIASSCLLTMTTGMGIVMMLVGGTVQQGCGNMDWLMV